MSTYGDVLLEVCAYVCVYTLLEMQLYQYVYIGYMYVCMYICTHAQTTYRLYVCGIHAYQHTYVYVRGGPIPVSVVVPVLAMKHWYQ